MICETKAQFENELASRAGGIEVRGKLLHELAQPLLSGPIDPEDDVLQSILMTTKEVPANRLPVILSRAVANRLAQVGVSAAPQTGSGVNSHDATDSDDDEGESINEESNTDDDADEVVG